MGKKLYVGNLPFKLTQKDFQEIFEVIGTVVDSRIITDRDTGLSKGFGFIEYESEDDAQRALSTINGYKVLGRVLSVSEARERNDNLPRLQPISLGTGECLLCGKRNTVYGYENNLHGVCKSCIKAISFYLRK